MTLALRPDDIDFKTYMVETENGHKVKPAPYWEADLNDEFRDQGEGDVHPRLPWSRLANRISIRPGEVSVWFGFNGHGKSLLLGQAVLGLVAQGERCCVASFEMRPRKTLARMARQFTDAAQPTPGDVRSFVQWAGTDGRLWLYDHTGSVQAERVFAVIRYTADKLGVTQFVVDNLTKMIASDDDYAGQKAIVDKLTALAQALSIHIHLVHHARKDRDENRPPRKMDAMGAGAITNLVDNLFVVWRNKAKYEAAAVDPSKPDAMLICDKQRNGTSWEGVLNLTYHERSKQYVQSGFCAMDMRTYPHAHFEPRAGE